AARKRLVGHAERAARERAAAGQATAAAVPGGIGEAKDVEPADALAGAEIASIAGEAQAHLGAPDPARDVGDPEAPLRAGARAGQRAPALTAASLKCHQPVCQTRSRIVQQPAGHADAVVVEDVQA